MSDFQFVVFAGPCGAGKTTLRLSMCPPESWQTMDMADYHSLPFAESRSILSQWIRDMITYRHVHGNGQFALEGVFSPQSMSLGIVRSFQIPFTLITIVPPYEECQRRIMLGPVEAQEGRLRILAKTYYQFK